jgi:NADPH:quinone reductase
MVTFGNASGPVPPFAPLVLSSKCLKVCRPNAGVYVAEKEYFELYATELMHLLSNGHLKITISRVYDLKDAAQAHTDLEVLFHQLCLTVQGRKTTGKLLLKCN